METPLRWASSLIVTLLSRIWCVFRKRFWNRRRAFFPHGRAVVKSSSPPVARIGASHPRRSPLGSFETVLLLFDIDGTLLIRAHVEHRLALAEAVREVWGAVAPGPAAVPAAGRTDIEIAREICLLGGVTAAHFDDGTQTFGVACACAYARLAPADLHDRLAPDAQRVLADLAARAGVRLSLVTGNLEAVARIKLERSGLADFF